MRQLSCAIFFLLMFIDTNAQNTKEDFESFREKILSDYQGFRKSIIENYGDFLNSTWSEYERFLGKHRNPFPKPKMQPVKPQNSPTRPPIKTEPSTITPIAGTPIKKTTPIKPSIPIIAEDKISFRWYGTELTYPKIDLKTEALTTQKKFSHFWKQLIDSKLVKTLLPEMEKTFISYGMNDWCVYLVVKEYVDRLLPKTEINAKTLTSQFILLCFGYDARIALCNGRLFLLLPFEQEVYSRNFIKIEGKPYYIFGEQNNDTDIRFSTYPIPKDIDAGRALDLIFYKELKLPYKGEKFSLNFYNIHLTGEVNENLIDLMRHYPQIPIPCYAMSKGDSYARKQLLSQLQKQIQGLSIMEAANILLHFVQSFKYATDDEQFGYEKPFFFEEVLFYPQCDCEDRAIFYQYLVTQLLGLDVHFVHYPMHECTAIHFSNTIDGDGYIYDGKLYLICDPTYIGADIGMCMPEYQKTKPEIEFIK